MRRFSETLFPTAQAVCIRVSQTINGEYFIDDEKVFESQYEKYLDSIKYYDGMEIEELK